MTVSSFTAEPLNELCCLENPFKLGLSPFRDQLSKSHIAPCGRLRVPDDTVQ